MQDPHADPNRIPRRTNPLSFLSKSAFVLATMFALSSSIVVEAAAANDCVCNYNPNVDYFPNKLVPNYSSRYKIEYFKSYKTMTLFNKDGADEHVFYLYLCGTPAPQIGNVNNSIEIPIKSAAVTSTTFVPFIEYINERDTLHFVSTVHTDFKPCLRKMYDDGQVADGYTFDAAAMVQANKTAYARTGDALDIVLMDDWNFNNGLRDTLMETLGPRTKSIYIGEQLEVTPLGKLEWTEVIAALYNKEHDMLNAVLRMNARYECVKNRILNATALTKKNVLWGNCYLNTFMPDGGEPQVECYPAQCPGNYYCDLIKDAGGVPLPASKFVLTVDEMLDLAEEADVWIYTDPNFNQDSAYTPAFFTPEVEAKFASVPVIQNKQVYDILGKMVADWFEDAKAEPGVLLMDLVQAFHGNEIIPANLRNKDFLRNVFTEDVANQAERLGSQCEDPNAPVYNGWDVGFCTIPATTPVLEHDDMQLCATEGKPSLGLEVLGNSLVMTFTVVFAAMWM